MKHKKEPLTRRDFIKGAGCAAVGVAVGLPVLADEVAPPVEKSTVVLIRNKAVVSADGKIDGMIVQQMLDDAVMALFGKKTPQECFGQILSPDDVVGIKSNEWRSLPTPPEVEQAIRRRVLEVGVSEKNISIADRKVMEIEIFQKSTALINVRPMRTHAWAGVGSLTKNYIMFVDDRPDYHGDACASLAKLWDLPVIKGKTRLNVLVMLTPQFHTAGPHHFDPSFVWTYGGMIVATDPVAADSIGLQIIQQKRQLVFGKNRPLQPTAHHIALADTEYGLGQSDRSKINLIRLGWEEDVLI